MPKKTKKELKELTGFSVYGKKWKKRGDTQNYEQWGSKWFCPDGDSAELHINKDGEGFAIKCFSGIGGSEIAIEKKDFGTLWRGIFKEKTLDVPIENCTYVQRCIILADFFCGLFCEWSEE